MGGFLDAHRGGGPAGRRLGPWYVAGGWAVDLFRGEQTRGHGDLEIAVPAARFPEIRARFPEFVFDVVASDRIWELTPEVADLTHQPGGVPRRPATRGRGRPSAGPEAG
ncbi:nucleotidyltransferase domain-containing protein [Kitasatospora sp. NPDC058218]|uniref:nucleotidyltransferase domain-containing protein n=1 Tax=Kitasatospora sp. NPDC058218 TaxID=3346385 RepID=UPI0036DD2654